MSFLGASAPPGISEPPLYPARFSLDACLCLLVALHMVEQKECLMVGDIHTGYVVVPHGAVLAEELEQRCVKTDRVPSDWVRPFRLQTGTRGSP